MFWRIFFFHTSLVWSVQFRTSNKGTKMNSVKIAVNQNRLISNLGTMFSSSITVIAEILQNSRRAGATSIYVEETEDSLIFSDNGSGINSFQDLLTLAQSAWDEKIMDEDSPYGLGFFSALFAAEYVVVKSKGKQISIDTTKNLLDQVIDIFASNVTIGTVVELHHPKIKGIHASLVEYAKGFPIDIYFSGSNSNIYDQQDLCSQRLSNDRKLSSKFEEFECGHISIDIERYKNNFVDIEGFCAYLQGFKIMEASSHRYVSHDEPIVHLDSSFQARMPDRDTLINADYEKMRITSAIKKVLRAKLMEIKRQDPKDLFSYHRLVTYLDFLDIYNDINNLPVNFFSNLAYPETKSYYDDANQRLDSSLFFKEADLTGKAVIDGTSIFYDNCDGCFAMALQMAVFINGNLVLEHVLHPKHWVYRFVRELPNDLADASQIQVRFDSLKSSKWEGLDIHLVNSYSISIPSLDIDVNIDSKHGLAIGCSENGDSDINQLIIPPGETSEVLKQVRSWFVNDDYQEHLEDEDRASLDGCLALLRGENQSQVVQQLIQRSDWSIRESLKGKTFSITFGEKGEVKVTTA